MCTKLLAILEKKGIISTVLGILFSAPINAWIVYKFFDKSNFSNQELITACICNFIGMVWFMLPSVITIKSKLFEITIKD
jgi:hypothetical protein